MGRLLLALTAVLTVASCSEEYEKYCHNLICPHYQLIDRHETFEERSYVATTWISTTVESPKTTDLSAAYQRLKSFCDNNGEAGYNMSHTWPALISMTENSLYFLQWFVPPDTVVPAVLPADVTVVVRPAATVYVRVFGGMPSLDNGQSNAEHLSEDLDEAHKSYNHDEYIGAGFDSILSLTHHNELWIYAA